MKIFAAFTFLAAFAFNVVLGQQATSPKNVLVPGDVITVDAGKIAMRTKDGELTVTLSDKTVYKKVLAETPIRLSAASAGSLSDIAVGDKLLVSGILAADSTLPAKTVYILSKSDLEQRNAKDRERWTTRGISGRVAAVNPDTQQISIEVRGLAGLTPVVVSPKEKVLFRRYAPNSVRYSESLASSLSDIKPGDMLRAVGDRSPDGASFAAEEILTGAFATLAGPIKSIDVQKNEIVVGDLQSKKDVVVSLQSAMVFKRFPEQIAQMMAARQAAGPNAGGGPGQRNPAGGAGMQPGMRPAADGAPTAPRSGPGPGRPRGGIDEMLETFPTISASDLKVGEVIAVSFSKSAAMDRITAIKLLAGVEPFLAAAQASSGRQSGQNQTLNIPGLDGVVFQ